MTTRFTSILLLFVSMDLCISSIFSAEMKEEKNIPYYPSEVPAQGNEYQKTQCRLDLIFPEHGNDFATVVWFHGGGLTGGTRHVPLQFQKTELYRQGNLALAIVEYRLSPKVEFPVFIEDAAAAVAWVLKNIQRYGGDPNRVFVSGGSAGGYLTAMVGMDSRWLAAHKIDHNILAGLIPVSGQMTTHFHVKKVLKIPGHQYRPVIDENAPLYYCDKNIPPFMAVMGDRKIEWKVRVEENELLCASLRAMGHPLVRFSETPGIGHGISGMADHVSPEVAIAINEFMERAIDLKKKEKK